MTGHGKAANEEELFSHLRSSFQIKAVSTVLLIATVSSEVVLSDEFYASQETTVK